jgi:hypothetical protein
MLNVAGFGDGAIGGEAERRAYGSAHRLPKPPRDVTCSRRHPTPPSPIMHFPSGA